MLNTLFTLQNLSCTICKNNSLHGNTPLGWPKTPCFSYLHHITCLCPPLVHLLPPYPSLLFLAPPPSLLIQPRPTLFLLRPHTCRRLFLLHTSSLLPQHFTILPPPSFLLPISSFLPHPYASSVLRYVLLPSFRLILSVHCPCPFFHHPMPLCLPSPYPLSLT